MPKVSIVVPCYNEQESLPLFFTETEAVLWETGCDYEFIFIDDGSSDETP